MAACTSILTAVLLFAASVCANHCDLQSLKSHACCHHEKAPPKVDLSCAHVRDKVDVSFYAADFGFAPGTTSTGSIVTPVERAAEPRPPDSSPPAFRTLRI